MKLRLSVSVSLKDVVEIGRSLKVDEHLDGRFIRCTKRLTLKHRVTEGGGWFIS